MQHDDDDFAPYFRIKRDKAKLEKHLASLDIDHLPPSVLKTLLEHPEVALDIDAAGVGALVAIANRLDEKLAIKEKTSVEVQFSFESTADIYHAFYVILDAEGGCHTNLTISDLLKLQTATTFAKAGFPETGRMRSSDESKPDVHALPGDHAYLFFLMDRYSAIMN